MIWDCFNLVKISFGRLSVSDFDFFDYWFLKDLPSVFLCTLDRYEEAQARTPMILGVMIRKSSPKVAPPCRISIFPALETNPTMYEKSNFLYTLQWYIDAFYWTMVFYNLFKGYTFISSFEAV